MMKTTSSWTNKRSEGCVLSLRESVGINDKNTKIVKFSYYLSKLCKVEGAAMYISNKGQLKKTAKAAINETACPF